MKCGWVNAEDLLEPVEGYGVIDGMPFVPETCPGYTGFLPEVQEVARAWGWEQSSTGFLRRYEVQGLTVTRRLIELVDSFAGEQSAAQEYERKNRTPET